MEYYPYPLRKHEYKLEEVDDSLGLSYPTIRVIAKHVAGPEERNPKSKDLLPGRFKSF